MALWDGFRGILAVDGSYDLVPPDDLPLADLESVAARLIASGVDPSRITISDRFSQTIGGVGPDGRLVAYGMMKLSRPTIQSCSETARRMGCRVEYRGWLRHPEIEIEAPRGKQFACRGVHSLVYQWGQGFTRDEQMVALAADLRDGLVECSDDCDCLVSEGD